MLRQERPGRPRSRGKPGGVGTVGGQNVGPSLSPTQRPVQVIALLDAGEKNAPGGTWAGPTPST